MIKSKQKLKILFFVVLLAVLCVPIITKAADEQTAQTTINGVTVNWTYELNESNQIKNLKCTNPEVLTGNVTVPSTIDGKTVISIGSQGFSNATGITGVIIPSTIKEIEYRAFEGCTNLTSVDLGQLEKISFKVFANCEKLKTIKIPKTLTKGPTAQGVFTGKTKLTSVTFEDGLTKIPEAILMDCIEIKEITIPNSVTTIGAHAFDNTGITKITLPSSVKEIEYSAFERCTNLTSVDLGQLEEISFKVFMNCENLKTIKIPKTLTKGTIAEGVFTGKTKLTSVTFEDGLTKIPDGILWNCTEIKEVTIPSTVTTIGSHAFSNTGITKITLPSSVKEIEYSAFEGCTNLTSVDLGQLKKISFKVFKGCTSLTEITIPNTVTDIDFSAFDNCGKLEKITIPKNVKSMGLFASQPNKDTVFANHNENLTIYCHKGSVSAQYAINNNIKYVYLKDEIVDNEEETDIKDKENKNDAGDQKTEKPSDKNGDTTTATGTIPQTGLGIGLTVVIAVVTIGGTIFYKKYNKLKEI